MYGCVGLENFKLHALIYDLLCSLYPYYSLFYILCILNKKKKKLYKYIYVYKEGKFVFYHSLRHYQAAREAGGREKFPTAKFL